MVRGLTCKAIPIWRLVEPLASHESTSRSRVVNDGNTRPRHGPAALKTSFGEQRPSRGKPLSLTNGERDHSSPLNLPLAEAYAIRTST